MRPLADLRVGIPSGQHQLQARWLGVEQFQHLGQVHQPEFDGVVDLIQDNELENAGVDFCAGQFDGALGIGAVLVIGNRVALDAADTSAGLVEFDQRCQPFHPFDFAAVEITLHELDDTDPHLVADRHQGHSQRRAGLALSVTGQNNDPGFVLGFLMLHIHTPPFRFDAHFTACAYDNSFQPVKIKFVRSTEPCPSD